jgi:ketosteroid isomerase-like protein
MKIWAMCWTAGALLVAGCASTRPAPTASPESVKAEVRLALQKWNDAAGRGDLAACMSQFDDTADIQLVGSDRGEVFRGRVEIETWLGKLMARNRFGWQMDRVDIDSSGDTAWAFVEGTMTVRDREGKVRATTPYRFTGVLVKRGDGWGWRLFHGSVPAGE